MSNVLIIDAGKSFGHSGGALNHHLSDVARDALTADGHAVRVTKLDDGYDIGQEVENFLWADTVIYQMPAWWMGGPWTLKKYMDEVFTAGYGKLFRDDGRSSKNPTRNYGRGGLLQGKTYMLSVTWNAPVEAFTDPAEFFEGRGVDAVYFPFHKANQFLGMVPLPTFMCNDVMKQPQIDADVARFKSHLKAALS